ncbi:LacI family transcriptional regulator [Thalassobacillus devorans]|uniref:LacI family transcriptional regulator n=1 Tax=Thalassobacillus devorans TaxID=279813 RepID=A0ABQ1NVJ5_9BACI|nr:LacI family DNA-binding transcriptional regulator [Thalassobacillus devorans]NIK28736.1 LacI family transcriptional regulator [Thalassobacillus devorans]GGC83963.1 LacI family transcriptional regulator [Thalassobacillus devorans]
MGVTIKDVAKAAGVSYSTVSKALRDSPLVKQPTKERILAIAHQLGYQPNAAARSLVSKRSYTIGVVWPTIERAAHSAMITSLNKQLEKLSYTTLISINEMEFAINIFNRYQVDAILAFDDGHDQNTVQSSVPVVTYGLANGAITTPTVDANRRQAIKSAVEYLASIGHQKICYIGDLTQKDRLQEEKVAGFKQAIEELGLENIPMQVIEVSDLEQYDGFEAAKKLLAQETRPTAIISGTHDLTRGIIRSIHEAGLSVPDDFSVISYDNIPQSENFEVALTTVGVPLEKITEKLSEILMDVIDEKEVEHAIFLEPELRISESSRPL